MPEPKTLHLTTGQVIETVQRLDGETLPTRTLALWAKQGIVTPSIRHDGIRGREHPRLYNLSDTARVRLIVRLRHAGISMLRVRLMLADIDAQLRHVWKPTTNAVLAVDGRRAYIVQPGQVRELGTGQLRLHLDACFLGVDAAARQVTRAA